MSFKGFKIKILGTPNREQVIASNPAYIGRSLECQVSFSGNGVSRKHIQIEFFNDSIFITDLNSRNGTYLNDNKINQGEKVQYQFGDRLILGNSHEVMLITLYDKKLDSEEYPPQIHDPNDPKNSLIYEDEEDLEIVKYSDKKDSFEKSVQADGVRSFDTKLEENKDQLAMVNEELRNSKAKLHQKLKIIELEIENRRLELESNFLREKNEKEKILLSLEKEITIKKNQLDVLSTRAHDKVKSKESS